MTIWFTADNHFGHKRIIELAKRPFKSVEEMDEVMIARWNHVVQKDDLVYHLGDFAFAPQEPYLERLKGCKRLIRGNHDHKNRMAGKGWEHVSDIEHISISGQSLVLFHYAMRVWNKSGHGAIQLYGHSHNNLEGDAQSCDVGVDAWMFQPITFEMIKQKLSTYPKRVEPDHHGAPYKEEALSPS